MKLTTAVMQHTGIALLLSISALDAQTKPQPASEPTPKAAPATKLEAFHPTAGTVFTKGYDDLGSVAGVNVILERLKDSSGANIMGIIISVPDTDDRGRQSFIDADEVPELVKGLDDIIALNSNPTAFKYFEVSYVTRGYFGLTAFNNDKAELSYEIQAGRQTPSKVFVTLQDMKTLKTILGTAATKIAVLNTTPIFKKQQ